MYPMRIRCRREGRQRCFGAATRVPMIHDMIARRIIGVHLG